MRTLLLPSVLALAVALGACGSSTPSSSTSSTTSTSTTAPSTSAGSVPAVTNATNLNVAPVISAGTPPPPSQLVTKDLVVGKGTTATHSSIVTVQYVGANYADGKNFDSSWDRGQPATFPLVGVIPGFAQGIVGMKVGGRREIVIPPALGYGSTGKAPAVTPNETLVFVVDLVSLR